MSQTVPDQLTGLWRRRTMIWPDGRVDTSTTVFWLQTQSLYADIRIPANRPKAPAENSFEPCRDADLISFAEMYGFAGTLTVEGTICRWQRAIDYHPPGGPPDEAHFELEGELLIETGIHADYREDWVRQTAPDAALTAFRQTGGRDGFLVIAGDHFILAQDRAGELPPAESLAALVERDLVAGNRTQALARLDMLIAYGRIGTKHDWRITLSTLPWLEASPLFGACRFIPATGTLETDRGAWILAGSTLPAAEISSLFSGSPS